MQQLAESSLQRLRNWDISEEQVRALAKSGDAKRTLTFRSPVAGIVTEKKAVQGMRFMPGEALYQIADTVRGLGAGRRLRAGHCCGQRRPEGQNQDQRLPRRSVRRPHRLRLSDAEGGNADGAGAHRTGQSERQAEAGDVRRCRHPGRRRGAGADRADLGGDRQRPAPGGDRAAGRRALRAAPGQARAAWR